MARCCCGFEHVVKVFYCLQTSPEQLESSEAINMTRGIVSEMICFFFAASKVTRKVLWRLFFLSAQIHWREADRWIFFVRNADEKKKETSAIGGMQSSDKGDVF